MEKIQVRKIEVLETTAVWPFFDWSLLWNSVILGFSWDRSLWARMGVGIKTATFVDGHGFQMVLNILLIVSAEILCPE